MKQYLTRNRLLKKIIIVNNTENIVLSTMLKYLGRQIYPFSRIFLCGYERFFNLVWSEGQTVTLNKVAFSNLFRPRPYLSVCLFVYEHDFLKRICSVVQTSKYLNSHLHEQKNGKFSWNWNNVAEGKKAAKKETKKPKEQIVTISNSH